MYYDRRTGVDQTRATLVQIMSITSLHPHIFLQQFLMDAAEFVAFHTSCPQWSRNRQYKGFSRYIYLVTTITVIRFALINIFRALLALSCKPAIQNLR